MNRLQANICLICVTWCWYHDMNQHSSFNDSHEQNSPTAHICSRQIISYLLLVLSILLYLLSAGCITEQYKSLENNCRNDNPIVERYGDFSNAQDTVSISLRTLKIYHFEPFWESSITIKKPMQTFTYSLTTPPSDAELSKWYVVSDESTNRFIEKRFDILDEDARYFKSRKWYMSPETMPRHKNPLILPICYSRLQMVQMTELSDKTNYASKKDTESTNRECIAYRVHIHPEDIHYLSRPFLYYKEADNLKLQIPYKIDNGVFYLYSPKDSEQLFRPTYSGWEQNTATHIWGVIIPPVTLVLDIVLLPLEAIGLVIFINGLNY